jgi:hypothetical protein
LTDVIQNNIVNAETGACFGWGAAVFSSSRKGSIYCDPTACV